MPVLIVISGLVYQVTLKKAASGFDYEVRDDGKLVCTGWTAGTRAEAVKEAKGQAFKTLAKLKTQ